MVSASASDGVDALQALCHHRELLNKRIEAVQARLSVRKTTLNPTLVVRQISRIADDVSSRCLPHSASICLHGASCIIKPIIRICILSVVKAQITTATTRTVPLILPRPCKHVHLDRHKLHLYTTVALMIAEQNEPCQSHHARISQK
jgi:hypothetical protein